MIDIMRSEWTKLRSVRSTVWTLVVAFVLMVGIGGLVSWAVISNFSAGGSMSADESVMTTMIALPFAAIAMATLGVLVVSSEYRTGMIRTSLQAVPQRLAFLTGKTVVFTVTALVVGQVTVFAAFFVSQSVLAIENLDTTLSNPEVLRAVVGSGLYLTASGLFGLGLGALIRHTPGAIVAAMSLILVLPQIASMLPGDVGAFIAKTFTANAGQQLTRVVPRPGWLEPWPGFAVYLTWVAVALITAMFLLRKRDA